MRRTSLLAGALLVTAWAVCLTARPGRAAGISRVEVSPRVLDVTAAQEVRIRFHLSAAATVTIVVCDDHQSQVWSKMESFKRGYGQFHWDGHGSNGRIVADGIYAVVLKTNTVTSDGETSDPGDRPVAVYDLALDHPTGLVSYRLAEPASVEVRLGVGGGGPLLRTMDALQGPGEQAVHWDGWDDSRVVNLLGNPNVLASVRATSLPDNSIIVRNGTPSESRSPVSFHVRLGQRSATSSTDRRDVLVAEVGMEGDVDAILDNDNYEWIFFVDHRFVFEEEKLATNPYVFELDISSLSEGEHVLTVNLTGREDNLVRSFSERFAIDR